MEPAPSLIILSIVFSVLSCCLIIKSVYTGIYKRHARARPGLIYTGWRAVLWGIAGTALGLFLLWCSWLYVDQHILRELARISWRHIPR